MSMTIYTNGAIELDGQATGLQVRQYIHRTGVYCQGARAKPYRLTMPATRYTLSSDKPERITPVIHGPKFPGRAQFEHAIREYLASAFRDWFNNYTTLATFAAHRGLDETAAAVIVETGRRVHNKANEVTT